ncbi:MAG: ribosome silencing factor [Clostridia bacterium]|nr:ribosome silencing factor [Clostridia bacterium]
MKAREKAIQIAAFLDSKKAEDVQILYVEEHTALTSYFVLAHGNNAPQVKSLADYAEDKMAELGFLTCKRERDTEATWYALDYEDVIIHIFQRDTRDFFDLEHIWAAAERIPLPENKQEEGQNA